MSIMSELDIERQESFVSIETYYEQHGWSIDPLAMQEQEAALDCEAYD